jgi:hypothetical protein
MSSIVIDGVEYWDGKMPKPLRADTYIGRLQKRTKLTPIQRVYIIWYNMWSRCYNLGHKSKDLYSSRGIRVCTRWLSFTKFVQDIGYTLDAYDNRTLDRIDNNKGYSPANCRLATHEQQALNRRKFRAGHNKFKGITQTPGLRWNSSIKYKNKPVYLGVFASPEEAAAVYNVAYLLLRPNCDKSLLNDVDTKFVVVRDVAEKISQALKRAAARKRVSK